MTAEIDPGVPSGQSLSAANAIAPAGGFWLPGSIQALCCSAAVMAGEGALQLAVGVGGADIPDGGWGGQLLGVWLHSAYG